MKINTFVRFMKPSTIAYFVAFIVLGLFTSVLGPTLPGLAENTHTSLSAIGFLFTARSLGYLIGSLRGGQAYDRMPGHILVASVILVMGAMAFLAPFMSQLWLLTLVIFLLGIGEGTLDVGVNLLLVWTNRGRAGPFLNALHFFFGLGAFLSPIIVAQVLLIQDDINWAFWILTLFALPLAFWFTRLASPDIPAADQENGNNQVNLLFVLIISTLFFLYVGAEVSFGGWIFTYATSLKLGDATSAAYLTSAFWGALTVGRLIGIPMAERFAPKKLVFGDLIGCLASMGVILLFPMSYAAVWVAAICLGLFMSTIFPALLAFAERRMTLSGKITRWFFVATGAGGMVLPWLFGVIFESINPYTAMLAIMLDLLLAFILFGLGNIFENRIQRIALEAG